MSKKIRSVLTLSLLSFLLAAAALFGNPAGAAQRQQPRVAANAGKNTAIVAATAAVLKETSEIRELPILHPVKSGAQTRADIERMVLRNLDEQTSVAEMHATELSMKKLGMAPPDFQYRAFLIKLLTEQVAGYYDPKIQEFFLAEWIDLEGQKPVMAHELTHALQDQHFNLRRFENWPKGDSDAELATHSLVEGDATLAMTLYLVRYPLVALAFSRSLGASGASEEQFKQAPRMLRDSLVFPYLQGSEWATALYRRGGWSAVSQAFTDPPQSTEQILHPEKYFAHEAPVKVNLPDVRALLGAKWKRQSYDVNGEWGYYLILDQYLNAPADSKRAAAGWGGDRYEIYEGAEPGEVFLAQLTAWDTENDAREFFDAYAKRTGLRYEKAQAKEVQTEQSKGATDRREWTTTEGGVVLELRGNHVLVLEGAPVNTNLGALTKALWQ
jgi:hypothetical protein